MQVAMLGSLAYACYNSAKSTTCALRPRTHHHARLRATPVSPCPFFVCAIPQDAGGPSSSGSGSEELVFVRPEDQFLHARAAWHFVFPVEGRPVAKDGLAAHRLVMAVGGALWAMHMLVFLLGEAQKQVVIRLGCGVWAPRSS